MKITEILHENVLPDGTFSDKRGAIHTDGRILYGDGHGCGSPGCHCSDGYWISIIQPLKDGKVKGLKVDFDNKDEYEEYLENQELSL